MNLAGKFAESVKRYAKKTAVFWGDRTYAYDDLWAQSLFVSGVLRHQFGVKPGDRVALWLKNCPQFIPALFGVLQTGAVVVPINNFLKPDEVSYILRDAGIEVIITDSELSANFQTLKASQHALKLLNIENVLAAFCGPDDFDVDSEIANEPSRAEHDLAVLIYTSGTTGRPKGAMLSHANLLHNVESCRECLHTVETDRFAVLLPMFHSYMLTVGIFLPIFVGGSILIVKSLHPARNVIQEIFTKQPTILPAFPQFYRSLLNAEIPAKLPLRICVSGSAPLPGHTLHDFEKKFGVPLIEGYGLSEASPVVSKNPLDGTHKPGSIGIPIPNVEMSIQNDDGKILGPREIGEICVRGENVMMGYWNQPEETAKVFRNGWLLTGDVGYCDEDGYYFITDRKKDMLLVNGNNVYPREIEEVIYQFPNVKETAVVGVPDARRGEQAVAFVVPNEGATIESEALMKFVRGKIADYKVPRKIILANALPRNATGKILKTTLRDQLARNA
jgi:long-chain acyl-CoA synthetase